MTDLERARRWAYLWKQEAQIKNAATKDLSRLWQDLWRENQLLREYAVHKHNNCWQTGKCECGLDDVLR